MNKSEKFKNAILYIVFILYISFLIKLLFVSRFSSFNMINGYRSINLIPFESINNYMYSFSNYLSASAFSNVIGNVVIFIPLGVCLILFKKNKGAFKSFFLIFLISFFTEVIQFILAIGVLDIDDIILNTLGGLIGILLYKLLFLIMKDESKVKTFFTVLAILTLPVLLFLLFKIQLRL